MIIFLDEERAYLSWVAHHRTGFVLDCLRPLSKGRRTLHRAICPEIKASANKRTYWTTGRHMKACALDEQSLKAWAAETGAALKICPNCLTEDGSPLRAEPLHLSHLDREVLSLVSDVALVHLNDRDGGYLLTVGKTAKCLAAQRTTAPAPPSKSKSTATTVINQHPSSETPPACGCIRR